MLWVDAHDVPFDADRAALAPTPVATGATFRTRAAHAGEDTADPVRPLISPVHQSAVYAFADASLADAAFAAGEPLYARDGLPNVRALERAVADLEGAADAHAVASGMAAISLTFLSLLAAGDHVVAPVCCYCDTSALLTEHLARFGIRTTLADPNDPVALRSALDPRTRLVIVETISNPAMALADLPRIAAIAHEGGALLCVDNTFATPALCRPLDHGADLVVHSAGKFLGGHQDVTAGIVAGGAALIERIRRTAYLTGPTLAPLEAWLTLRGIKTLAPRMAWVSQTAATVAAFLAGHPAVARVRYPGRPPADRADLTRRLLPIGAGGLLAFDLSGGPAAAERAIRALKTIPYVPSVGGTTTIVSYPPMARVAGDDASASARAYRSATIRLSVGLEDATDIIADLGQAMDAVSCPMEPRRDG